MVIDSDAVAFSLKSLATQKVPDTEIYFQFIIHLHQTGAYGDNTWYNNNLHHFVTSGTPLKR
jgi:hypothetical protein